MKRKGGKRKTRIFALKIFFICGALVIVGKATLLQLATDPRLKRLAERQFKSKISSSPRRGLILDRNGEGLAISLKVRSLFFRPELLKKEVSRADRQRIYDSLSKILSTPKEFFISKADTDKGFVWIKRQLSSSEESLIRDNGLLDFGDGIGLAEETRRFYPNNELASHILGSVSVDGNGIEGLELLFEQLLTGERTRISSNRDAMGRRIYQDEKGLIAFKDGQSLVLTIDKAIQFEAEKVLYETIQKHEATAGTAIVAKVDTGEVLALANYPTYNPNFAKSATAEKRRNRAVTDTYEPGSTFKALVVSSALESGVPPTTKIYCEKGKFRVGDRVISEAESHEQFEWLSFGEILKFSSNIGAAKTALQIGGPTLANQLIRFGVGQKTGIDLPGEVSGVLNTKEMNKPVRLANIGFGHGVSVTPIQILSYYLAIANQGQWIQPKIVKAILTEDPESVEKGTIRWKLGQKFEAPITKQVLSPGVANEVSQMLATVTTEKGTATKAQLDEWPVAGKTGTAQKIDPITKKYSRSKYISSFVGFSPAKNPKLISIVIIDEPKKGYYAGDTAAPAFKEIMKSALIREGIPTEKNPTKTIELANKSSIRALATTPISAVKKTSVSETNEHSIQALHDDVSGIKIPSLKGLTIREVVKAIGAEDLEINISGAGYVFEQYPEEGSWVKPGSKIKLKLHRYSE